MNAAAHRPARRRGFTLIEVLIALSMLSLLMLVLTAALRGLGEVETRVEQRIVEADDHRATVQLLTDVLGRVSARRVSSLQQSGRSDAPFFEAAPQSLAWIGVMPARYGLGGRHYLRLSLERDQLVLRYAPWTGAPAFGAWDQAEGQVLAAPVQGLSLRYLEPVSGQWSEVWPPPGAGPNELSGTLLPDAVQIQVHGAEPAWPPLVVALTATRASDLTTSTGSFGGGRR